ncbi:MAG: DMT family transporter [Clostridia bacterium]|nr:DMT family transporter [Clostridia bacterium]
MKERLSGAGMIAGMVLAWSVYYAVSKYAVAATGSAFAAGFLLRAAALVFLTAQLAVGGGFRDLFRYGRTTLLLILIGVFGFLLDLLANLGYAGGGSLGAGTALLKTDVLMVNLATVVLYRKRLYASDWIGTVVMLIGVLLVLGLDFRSFTLRPTDLFFLLSALCVTVNAFLIKRAQEKRGVATDSISYYNNFVVLMLFALFSGLRGDLGGIGAVQTPGFWALVALGGLAQTCIYFFYYRNLRRYEVWIVKLWLLLMPVVSCVIGVLFLGETMTAQKLIGIAIVLLGAGVILLRNKLHPEAAESKREETSHAV